VSALNKKAEQFQKYIKEQNITGFQTAEPENHEMHPVYFHSNFNIAGSMVPFELLFDDTPFVVLRILVAPRALHDDNELSLNHLANHLNNRYKPYKFVLNDAGDLMLQASILTSDDNGRLGDLVRFLIECALRDLTAEYKTIMQTVWGSDTRGTDAQPEEKANGK